MMDFRQTLSQSQIQTMSQKQIQALNMLAMGTSDLVTEIYREAEQNPALEVQGNETAVKLLKRKSQNTGLLKTSSFVSLSSKQASDAFSKALESAEDLRETLQEHLLKQLRVEHLKKNEEELGERLIYNLSEKGFHVLSPLSLLDKNDGEQDEVFLNKVMSIIQSLEPEGCCTLNSAESLLVQARLKGNAPSLALFILNGHLDFLDPPVASRALKKIRSFLNEQKKMFASASPDAALENADEDDVQRSIDFIKTLSPFPAQDYGSEQTRYVTPDIYVERLCEQADESFTEDFSKGIVVTSDGVWQVRNSKENMPLLKVDKSFELYSKEANDVVSESVKKAQDFIESVSFRQNTMLEASCAIVKKQSEFFSKGAGHLKALKQADIANVIGVHETTISRMANSKYIQCEWGLFEVKYFFVNAVADTSRDVVLEAVKKVLEKHKDDSKKLSDQKLSDELAALGLKVARRTVAKYRSMLNIASSYDRI